MCCVVYIIQNTKARQKFKVKNLLPNSFTAMHRIVFKSKPITKSNANNVNIETDYERKTFKIILFFRKATFQQSRLRRGLGGEGALTNAIFTFIPCFEVLQILTLCLQHWNLSLVKINSVALWQVFLHAGCECVEVHNLVSLSRVIILPKLLMRDIRGLQIKERMKKTFSNLMGVLTCNHMSRRSRYQNFAFTDQ